MRQDFRVLTITHLMRCHERLIPKISRTLSENGDYYDLLIALMESAAEKYSIDEFNIVTDKELLKALFEMSKQKLSVIGITKYLSGGKWYEK